MTSSVVRMDVNKPLTRVLAQSWTQIRCKRSWISVLHLKKILIRWIRWTPSPHSPPPLPVTVSTLKRTSWKEKKHRAGFHIGLHSYAHAILQLEINPRGKTVNMFIKSLFYFFEQRFDKFFFSGSELCRRIGEVCFSSGGWRSSLIRTAADPRDAKKRAAAETAGQKKRKKRKNVVRKQANSIIRPAPRVCAQQKCLRVWKMWK